MPQDSWFRPDNRSIEDLFFAKNGKKYTIPRYQRPYIRWKDQADDFRLDLNSDEQSNFIWSIVLDHGKIAEVGSIEIIDWQQRILTITIFMAVIRDLSKLLGDDTYADITHSDCIAYVTHRRESSWEYRITAWDSIRQFFQKYIQSWENSILEYNGKKDNEFKKLTKEQKLVKSNYEYFYFEIMSHIKELDEKWKIDFLKDLRDKVGQTRTISIDVYSDYDAYTIFETMNARWVDLSVADLLKNLIFSYLKSQNGIDTAKNKWDTIEENIISTESETKKFLRSCWLADKWHTIMKDLYKKLKKEINTQETATQYLDALLEYSNIYNLLMKWDKSAWTDKFNWEWRRMYMHIDWLRKMRIVSCYPIFLCILKNYNKLSDLNISLWRLFDAVEKFSFWYFTICTQPWNKIEKHYSTAAAKIQKEINEWTNSPDKINSIIDKLIQELKNNYPNPDIFKWSLKELEYNRWSVDIIKYMFYRLDLFLQSWKNRWMQKDVWYYGQDINRETITIEHILPQEPSKWSLKANEIKDYVNLIWNLTLLPPSPNKKAWNETLIEKIKSYSKCNFLITIELVKRLHENGLEWRKEEILNRTNELADQIADIFKL